MSYYHVKWGRLSVYLMIDQLLVNIIWTHIFLHRSLLSMNMQLLVTLVENCMHVVATFNSWWNPCCLTCASFCFSIIFYPHNSLMLTNLIFWFILDCRLRSLLLWEWMLQRTKQEKLETRKQGSRTLNKGIFYPSSKRFRAILLCWLLWFAHFILVLYPCNYIWSLSCMNIAFSIGLFFFVLVKISEPRFIIRASTDPIFSQNLLSALI